MLKRSLFLLILFVIFLIPLASADVVISEIMYHPSVCSYAYCEWIELHNNGDESVDLIDWTLCEKTLSAGYIDKEGNTHLDVTIVLPSQSHTIITDGGSGTEVYDNFAVDSNSIALHVDASSLCGGLRDDGETIILKDNNGEIIDSVSYDGSIADGDGNSLHLCDNSWLADIPTPGIENCPSEEPAEEEPAEETDNSNDVVEDSGSEEINDNDETSEGEEPEEEKPAEEKLKEDKDFVDITGQIIKNTADSDSDTIYESKSEKIKRNAVYLFALILLFAIIYFVIKDKA